MVNKASEQRKIKLGDREAYNEAVEVFDKAVGDYREAEDACNKAWIARNEAEDACSKAWMTRNHAWIAYSKAVAAHQKTMVNNKGQEEPTLIRKGDIDGSDT